MNNQGKNKKNGKLQIFQKFLMLVEENEFKIIKKVMPNHLEKLEQKIDTITRKQLAETEDEKEKEEIIKNAKLLKLKLKNSFNSNQLINYHIGLSSPTEFISYLEWNKQVHLGALKNDIFNLAILATLKTIQKENKVLDIITVFQLFFTAINYLCIELQKQNIERLKQVEPMLMKREERESNRFVNTYPTIAELIDKKMGDTRSLNCPTLDELNDMVSEKNQEQFISEMRILLEKENNRRGRKK